MPDALDKIATDLRRDILRMHQRGSNVGSALSVADVLAVLYFDVMNVPTPTDPARDRFILSKGHGAAALYAALARKGFIGRALLSEFLTDGSPLTGHPTAGEVPGVDVSTGSLGHGLPIAVGMALAAKQKDEAHRLFVLMGCGEMQEGSVWEGAMLAARLRLDNVIAVIDANNLQGYGRAEDIQPIETFAPKLEAFGWAVEEVNGHDCAALSRTLRDAPFAEGQPSAVVAHTVKGKGVAEMENQLGWHYFNVPDDKLNAFLDALDDTE